MGRLTQQIANGATTRFVYSGGTINTELDGANTVLRRYVFGPAGDEPIVWYEGSGITDRRFLQSDERGSIISVTNASGSTIAINSYDEYGTPAATNLGRFLYTGQAWMPEIGLYNYKARMYSPAMGRFLQMDPIGYGDGLNMYAYVDGDPINASDPSGMAKGLGDYTNIPKSNLAGIPSDPNDVANESTIIGTKIKRDFTSSTPILSVIFGDFPTISPIYFPQISPQNMQPISCVQDNKAFHDEQVAKAAKTFQSNGFLIIPNVSFRVAVFGSDGKLRVGPMAVADFVAVRNGGTAPGDRFIFEMKTGNGDFSNNQRMVYPLNGPTVVVPVGSNAVAAGYEVGQPILVVPNQLKVERCPR